MKKTFRRWDVDQTTLFPPSVRDFVPDGHLSHFVRDLVRDELDLRAIHDTYDEARGMPPYHPTMMTALLLYAYCRGVYSSRRIETACIERVDFMAVTAMSQPDHSTVNAFRKRHQVALQELFQQVLRLCRQAGLAKLGHVALDGTKMKASASKHKAMSYKRLKAAERAHAKIVKDWFTQAEAIDAGEDAEYGAATGTEMPDWVKTKQTRLEHIRAAKARLEAEAQAQAEQLQAERAQQEEETGRPPKGPPPRALEGQPEDKTQSNFTDPDSRIMRAGGTYEQAYNCQAAVDSEHQVIVSQHVVAKQNDSGEVVPTLDQIAANCGALPDEFSADSNYCSEANLEAVAARDVRAYFAVRDRKHQGPLTRAMDRRLRQGGRRSRYRLRKQVVEPVFGQIKSARGFTQFFRRGLANVQAEWAFLCSAHNLLKLFKAMRLA